VLLVHWNEAEAAERAERLRRAGFDPDVLRPEGMPSLRARDADPPAAVVIDLDRQPSQGRAVAIALRQRKATRSVPLVFVGGDPEKAARVRELLPDAAFAEWNGIGAAIRQAICTAPTQPVVPGTMSGYSGTPLVKKLAIKPNSTVLLVGAPPDFETTLGELPPGTRLSRAARKAPLVMLFVKSAAELEKGLDPAIRRMDDPGAMWICWPKKASGIQSDIGERLVRARGLDTGLVDYKICAVDSTWSGLLFARRRNRG
jgi:hypothetical protein